MKLSKAVISLLLSIVILVCSITTSFAVYGDMDDDEIHTTDDVILALQFASGIKLPTDEQTEHGDVDRDGYITSNDALMILRSAARQEDLPQHIYTDWVINAEPSCTINGVAICKCEDCSETFRKIIPPKGHTYIDEVCTDCGEIIHARAILYKNKSVSFGNTTKQLTDILGLPSEILSDTSTAKTVSIYIYCSDYAELGVFTFVDNKLTQFYTNSNSSVIHYDDSTFELSHITSFSTQTVSKKIGDVQITAYIDTLHEDGAYAYSYRASYGEQYNYTSTTSYETQEKLIFHMLNGCRAVYGKEPLDYCTKVQKVAYAHSLDMATNDYFNHTNLDGITSSQRITNAGIRWKSCGENIAAGTRDAYATNNGWYNSAGHRSNMLEDRFEKIGIGVAYKSDSSYQYYITENFYSDWD